MEFMNEILFCHVIARINYVVNLAWEDQKFWRYWPVTGLVLLGASECLREENVPVVFVQMRSDKWALKSHDISIR